MTGVLVSWAGSSTKFWLPCERGGAEAAVAALRAQVGPWFAEPGLTVEFGKDAAGAFVPAEQLDAARFVTT